MYPKVVVTALAICPVSIAHAQTMEPLSYTNSPIGLNFLVAGYAYQTGSVLLDPSLPIRNVKATVDSAFLAYSRVIDCWGQSGSIGLVAPYAWLSATGDVFAQSRTVDRTGWGDITLTGGRTSLNGSVGNDLQRNSRWGVTFAYALARHNSIKLYTSSRAAARAGADFRIIGMAWQYRWGAGL
jgi:hypothetical protein